MVEAVDKASYQQMHNNTRLAGTSCVTSAAGFPKYAEDAVTHSHPKKSLSRHNLLWTGVLTIHEAEQDGKAHATVDEDRIFEAMGFKAAGVCVRERKRE